MVDLTRIYRFGSHAEPKREESVTRGLTRENNEGLLIGDGIVIEVREVRGNQVKLGIEAPPWVRVLREEPAERQEPSDAA